uniref:Uncharacterized protein n=1 Tax=Romanomermis culicivorax TaxID=13658 RepID=A0A915I274_ROMCU
MIPNWIGKPEPKWDPKLSDSTKTRIASRITDPDQVTETWIAADRRIFPKICFLGTTIRLLAYFSGIEAAA